METTVTIESAVQAKEKKYAMVGDFGSHYGWLIDWERYIAAPWWKAFFFRNQFILASGNRLDMHNLAKQMNDDPGNAQAILEKWENN